MARANAIRSKRPNNRMRRFRNIAKSLKNQDREVQSRVQRSVNVQNIQKDDVQDPQISNFDSIHLIANETVDRSMLKYY